MGTKRGGADFETRSANLIPSGARFKPRRWVIGVDVDQAQEAPVRVLTSATKNLDVSLYNLIATVKDGTFHGGVLSQGVADGAVGWVYDERNRPLIPRAAYERVETLRQAMIAGLIRIPHVPTMLDG